jgi:hypothetical protein
MSEFSQLTAQLHPPLKDWRKINGPAAGAGFAKLLETSIDLWRRSDDQSHR